MTGRIPIHFSSISVFFSRKFDFKANYITYFEIFFFYLKKSKLKY